MMQANTKISFLFLLGIFFSTNLGAQRITSYVDSSQFLLGDFIHLKLRADVEDLESLLEINPLEVDSSGLELLKITPWKSMSEKNQKYFTSEVVFIGFDSGAFFIPSIEVMLENSEREVTREIPVFVGSDSLQLQELMSNKGLHYEGKIWQDYLVFIYVLVGLLIIGLLVRYWMKRSSNKEEEIEIAPPVPADIWALDALNELQIKELWQKGEVKQYYSKLSEILREFLERKYQFYALEMTTKEIIKNIRQQRKKEFPLAKTRDILEVSDMVKFAKYKPEEEKHHPYWKKTKKLVLLIHEMDPPQVEEEIISSKEEEE